MPTETTTTRRAIALEKLCVQRKTRCLPHKGLAEPTTTTAVHSFLLIINNKGREKGTVHNEYPAIAWFLLSLQDARWSPCIGFPVCHLSSFSLGYYVHEPGSLATRYQRGKLFPLSGKYVEKNIYLSETRTKGWETRLILTVVCQSSRTCVCLLFRLTCVPVRCVFAHVR